MSPVAGGAHREGVATTGGRRIYILVQEIAQRVYECGALGAEAILNLLGADGGAVSTVFSQKYLANSSISAPYLQYRPHFKAWYPCFLPSGESRIFTGQRPVRTCETGHRCPAGSRRAWPRSCAPGFPWTLDCERVLAGGVSKWGSQIKVRRRRREPGGRPGDAAGNGRGGRFSARRKRETVLRLLRGEDLESVSRELGITAARALAVAGSVSGRRPGQPEEPGAGRPGRGQSSAASQDR